ncbi:MAG: SDR family oxidoreductase [Bacteroidota bacterium]
MKRSYSGKVILITGGGSGLGQALCWQFAKLQAKVAFSDINDRGLRETAEVLKQAGATFLPFRGDVSQLEDCQRFAATVLQEFGQIDILVNNAGITHIKPFLPGDEEAVRRLMNINFMGSVYMWSVCDSAIRRQKGQLIVISSVAGFAPLYGRTAYAASKHALHGFFETLRTELFDDHVHVLMVCPSFIATGIRKNAFDGAGAKGKGTTGQIATPEQIAQKIIDAAASEQRLLITGKTGILSYWVKKLAPRYYEKQMLKAMRKNGM